MNPRLAPSRSTCPVILPRSPPTTHALYTSQLVSHLTNYVRCLADMSSLLEKRVVRFSDRPLHRTIQIQTDPHTVTTADPYPKDPKPRGTRSRADRWTSRPVPSVIPALLSPACVSPRRTRPRQLRPSLPIQLMIHGRAQPPPGEEHWQDLLLTMDGQAVSVTAVWPLSRPVAGCHWPWQALTSGVLPPKMPPNDLLTTSLSGCASVTM
jgi:hypothetical protein